MKRFGLFDKIFSQGLYLSLLNLDSDTDSDTDVIQCVKEIGDIIAEDKDLETSISLLFSDVNWRPHLVAAVAVLLTSPSERNMNDLWDAFDKGSWVSPQFAATASLRDYKFKNRLVDRVKNRCALMPSELSLLSPLERHSAAGPCGDYQRVCKNMASLISLAETISDLDPGVKDELESEDVQDMLKQDVDDSGDRALRWLSDIRKILDKYWISK